MEKENTDIVLMSHIGQPMWSQKVVLVCPRTSRPVDKRHNGRLEGEAGCGGATQKHFNKQATELATSSVEEKENLVSFIDRLSDHKFSCIISHYGEILRLVGVSCLLIFKYNFNDLPSLITERIKNNT